MLHSGETAPVDPIPTAMMLGRLFPLAAYQPPVKFLGETLLNMEAAKRTLFDIKDDYFRTVHVIRSPATPGLGSSAASVALWSALHHHCQAPGFLGTCAHIDVHKLMSRVNNSLSPQRMLVFKLNFKTGEHGWNLRCVIFCYSVLFVLYCISGPVESVTAVSGRTYRGADGIFRCCIMHGHEIFMTIHKASKVTVCRLLILAMPFGSQLPGCSCCSCSCCSSAPVAANLHRSHDSTVSVQCTVHNCLSSVIVRYHTYQQLLLRSTAVCRRSGRIGCT